MSAADRVRVLVTDWSFDDLTMERAAVEAAGLELVEAQCRTSEEVAAAARRYGAQALLVQYAPITPAVFRDVPEIQIVSRYGIGVDNVDLDAAGASQVWVCNVTGYGDAEVATHASALALAAARGLPWHDRSVRTGGWDYREARPIRRVGDQTLGVLGLGGIGRQTASLLGPFFGQVVGADPYLPASRWPDGVDRLEVEELFDRADVLTMHLPLTDETRHLVDAAKLDRMPEGSILVNTSRGGVVDEAALLAALKTGPLAAAALDVLEVEPAAEDHPLRSHPRALVTPHAAWYSATSEVLLRQGAVGNIVAWAADRVPEHVVLDPR